jgi:NADH-quinone oxidoreductase subunit A
MTTPLAIAAYLAFFVFAGFVFLFANLLLGKFLRPKSPNVEKLEVYECGEPTIGSSFVQFDLRFYVVALLFIIFDVEVAFFFPWATVFGKATQLMDPNLATVERSAAKDGIALTPAAAGLYRELGVENPTLPELPPELPLQVGSANAKSATSAGKAAGATPAANVSAVERAEAVIRADASRLALLSIADIAVFFAVLLVGFAYVWRRGDLDWVRAVSRERSTLRDDSSAPLSLEQQPVISA